MVIAPDSDPVWITSAIKLFEALPRHDMTSGEIRTHARALFGKLRGLNAIVKAETLGLIKYDGEHWRKNGNKD